MLPWSFFPSKPERVRKSLDGVLFGDIDRFDNSHPHFPIGIFQFGDNVAQSLIGGVKAVPPVGISRNQGRGLEFGEALLHRGPAALDRSENFVHGTRFLGGI